MGSPPYFRLIVLTVGTLLPFFWMIVILGHRRQRNLERVLFFLSLAITCFCGSSLLALNAQLYYGTPPHALLTFAWTFLCLGLWFIPPLVVHLHVEYGSLRELLPGAIRKGIWIAVTYLPAALLAPYLFAALRSKTFGFSAPSHSLGDPFQVWLLIALGIAFYWQRRFIAISPDAEQRRFHLWLSWDFLLVIANLVALFTIPRILGYESRIADAFSDLIILLAVVSPLLGFFRGVQNFNFLQIGRQRNLIYAVSGVFLALLYLSFVRRVGQWFDPYLPPAATAALLLFLPVIFFEPLQRMIRQLLQSTAQREMDSIHPLAMRIHAEASKGNLRALATYIEQEVRQKFQFEGAWLTILEPAVGIRDQAAVDRHGDQAFSIYRPGRLNGEITVRPHGSMISGEAAGAMMILSESIAGAIDMCIALDQKLELERELAERERMALVGQMAASISHNLKNPLGSIKTILQVQMESPELPASLRRETQMVLEEVNRLSGKLNQLLQFSRPAVRPPAKGERCNIVAVAVNVAEVLCREATSRGIVLELAPHGDACEVACSAEVANDVLSNVMLNAIEAASRDGEVSVGLACAAQVCTIVVEDNGPGVAPELRDKILQPFFTTKPRGTGLGLAIVTRRLQEIGGRLQIESPVTDGRGTRFRLEFPLAPKGAA